MKKYVTSNGLVIAVKDHVAHAIDLPRAFDSEAVDYVQSGKRVITVRNGKTSEYATNMELVDAINKL